MMQTYVCIGQWRRQNFSEVMQFQISQLFSTNKVSDESQTNQFTVSSSRVGEKVPSLLPCLACSLTPPVFTFIISPQNASLTALTLRLPYIILLYDWFIRCCQVRLCGSMTKVPHALHTACKVRNLTAASCVILCSVNKRCLEELPTRNEFWDFPSNRPTGTELVRVFQ